MEKRLPQGGSLFIFLYTKTILVNFFSYKRCQQFLYTLPVDAFKHSKRLDVIQSDLPHILAGQAFATPTQPLLLLTPLQSV